MPVTVEITPIPPVQVVGLSQAPAQVLVTPIPPVELKLDTGSTIVASNVINNEDLTYGINGVNVTFTTLFPFASGSLRVFLNGQRIRIVTDYQVSGNTTLILNDSPSVGEYLSVDYTKI